MKRTRFARLAVLLCVAAMLVLQGCGGDSDDSAEQDLRAQVDMLMAERDTATAAQMAAMEAQEAAETAQTTAMEAQTMAETRRDAAIAAEAAAQQAAMDAATAQATAEMERDKAEAAEAAAQTMLNQANVDLAAAEAARMAAVTAKMEADTAQMAAETARDAALTTQMAAEDARDAAIAAEMTAEQARMVAVEALKKAETERDAAVAAQNKAEAERDQYMKDLLALQGENSETENAAQTAADTKAAKMVADAIRDNLLAVTDDEDMDTNPDMLDPSIDELEITGAKDGVQASLDVTTNREEEMFTAADGPPSVGVDGWSGATLARTDPNADAIYVYSDIMAPEPEDFDRAYLLDAGDMITIGTEPTQYPVALAEWVEMPEERLEENQDLGDVFAGKFHGVDGTFRCVGDCAANISETTGNLEIIGVGTLTFEPEDPETEVMVADVDYVTFGFWLSKDMSATGTLLSLSLGTFYSNVQSVDAETFGGAELGVAAAILPLQGRATYQGPAAGKYVTRDLIKDTGKVGIFTADATLTADFDADGTPESEENDSIGTIAGRITNFMDGDIVIGENWRVVLDSVPFGVEDTLNPDGSFNGTTGATLGAGTAGGVWEAQLHGTRKDDHPAAVVGTFNAHADHASLTGGFGVHNVRADEIKPLSISSQCALFSTT